MKSERRIQNNKIRRKRELQKNILLTVLTLCFVLNLTFFAGGFLSRAKSSDEIVEYKYYASISVEEGDTLLSIAEEHMGNHYASKEAYIREVMQINSLTDGNAIRAGSHLVIPYYSTDFVE